MDLKRPKNESLHYKKEISFSRKKVLDDYYGGGLVGQTKRCLMYKVKIL